MSPPLSDAAKPDSSSAAEVRSRMRWIVLTLLLLVTIINFIDRQTVSVLAPVLRQTLHLSNEQYGRVVAAFQFGMMSGEFPMGWLMDRWGVRLGLAGAVLWWSLATGLQSATHSGFQLGLTRFWMGTGECGNYSGGIKAIFRSFAVRERTLAIGIFNTGSMVGATIAPPLVVYLLQHYSFRAAFLVPALLGLLWVPLWILIDRDVKPQTQKTSQTTSLPALLGDSIHSGELCLFCRFFIGPVMQFYWYWIPSYLYEAASFTFAGLKRALWAGFHFSLGDTRRRRGRLVSPAGCSASA